MKRAYEELGFTSKEQYLSLRSLAAGEFFAFGPAISREVIKTKIGEVATTHPKLGMRGAKIIPPTENIKAILQKLGDLPQEAQKEAQTVEELKAENTRLKREHAQVVRTTQVSEADIQKALQPHLVAFRSVEQGYKTVVGHWEKYAADLLWMIDHLHETAHKARVPFKDPGVSYAPIKPTVQVAKLAPMPAPKIATVQPQDANGDKPLTGGALRMLQVLVSRHPMVFTRSQLATLAYLSPRSGTFGTYLSTLRSGGFIQEEHDRFQATQAGLEYIGHESITPQTSEENIAMWREKLNGGARRMFDVLVSVYPEALSRDELAEQAGLGATTGTFGTYLSHLRSNELIEVRDGRMKASENLFM